MNSKEAMEEARQSILNSCIGDIALAWVRSLTDEEKQKDIIRAFNKCWIKGILLTREPEGKKMRVSEFYRYPQKSMIATIEFLEDISQTQKHEYIGYYKAFRKWLKDHWNLDG